MVCCPAFVSCLECAMKFYTVLFALLSLIGQVVHATTLPASVYQGYWAMTEPFLDEHIVVDFKETDGTLTATQYRFECDSTGTFRQLSATPFTLIPAHLEFLVYRPNSTEPESRLQLLWELPYEGIILKQYFNEQLSGLHELFPEGLQFAYAYTPILHPLCESE